MSYPINLIYIIGNHYSGTTVLGYILSRKKITLILENYTFSISFQKNEKK